jgi:hypothetical protein
MKAGSNNFASHDDESETSACGQHPEVRGTNVPLRKGGPVYISVGGRSAVSFSGNRCALLSNSQSRSWRNCSIEFMFCVGSGVRTDIKHFRNGGFFWKPEIVVAAMAPLTIPNTTAPAHSFSSAVAQFRTADCIQ